MRTATSSADRGDPGPDRRRPARVLVSVLCAATGLVAAGGLLGLPSRPAAALEGDRFAGDAKCALCHGELATAFAGAAHGRITGREHLCEDCHGPGADHVGTAGNRGKILSFRGAAPVAVADACLPCHAADGPEHAREFRGGPFESRGFTCTSCHRVHASAPTRPGAPSRAAATTATCRACHADDVYGSRFAHAGLEWDRPACASCHAGGDAHAREPGATGLVAQPARGDAPAEAALCLRCHAGFARPSHFAAAPADARCTTCHVLHRVPEARGGRASPVVLPEIADAGIAPPDGTLHGRLRAGGRLVGGEGGRYSEQVNLDDGLRVLLLELELGADDPDPTALRGSLRLAGAGDAHETLDLRLRRRGAWSVEGRGSRTEHPFLGGGGLHPGETLRERWSASLEAVLSPTVRIGAGHDAQSVEGDLRGTVLDGGSVLPVTGTQDRRDGETWVDVGVARDAWHFGLRQSWRTEDGSDDRDRLVGTPSGPDSLVWRDGSSAHGPATALVAGGDLLDGRLSVEATASLAGLRRDVDLGERRRGFAGVAPFTRTTALDGTGDRDLSRLALSGAWALDGTWAIEGGIERRTLREERDLVSREVLETGTGTTVTSAEVHDGLRQAILDARLGVRWSPRERWTLRGGAERRSDTVSGAGLGAGSVRSLGGYLGIDGDLGAGWDASIEGRSTGSRGRFTALTPRDRASVAARLAWEDVDGARFRATWRRTRLEADGSGLASEGDAVAASAGWGRDDGFTAAAGAGWRRMDLAVDRSALGGGGLGAGSTMSLVRALSLDGAAGVPLGGPFRLEARGAWTRDRGDVPTVAWDASLALLWRPPGALSAGLRLRRRRYDGSAFRDGDYDARILEAFVEIEW